MEYFKKVCIIIDDLGNCMKGIEEILSFFFKVNVVIMFFLLIIKEDVEKVYERGINIFVYMFMELKYGRKDWLGLGVIIFDLLDEEIWKWVEVVIDNVFYVVGMNNYMGFKIIINW